MGGDIGCNGGSGTFSFYVSEVGRYSLRRPFLVLNNEAFGKIFSEKINTRFIKSVEMVNNKYFIITSSEYAKNDSNSFPSRNYKYHLKRKNGFGDWKLVKKDLIE